MSYTKLALIIFLFAINASFSNYISTCGAVINQNTTEDLNFDGSVNGSYWFVKNDLISTRGNSCVTINANNLVLNMNGSAIRNSGSTKFIIGININASNVIIANGTIEDFSVIDGSSNLSNELIGINIGSNVSSNNINNVKLFNLTFNNFPTGSAIFIRNANNVAISDSYFKSSSNSKFAIINATNQNSLYHVNLTKLITNNGNTTFSLDFIGNLTVYPQLSKPTAEPPIRVGLKQAYVGKMLNISFPEGKHYTNISLTFYYNQSEMDKAGVKIIDDLAVYRYNINAWLSVHITSKDSSKVLSKITLTEATGGGVFALVGKLPPEIINLSVLNETSKKNFYIVKEESCPAGEIKIWPVEDLKTFKKISMPGARVAVTQYLAQTNAPGFNDDCTIISSLPQTKDFYLNVNSESRFYLGNGEYDITLYNAKVDSSTANNDYKSSSNQSISFCYSQTCRSATPELKIIPIINCPSSHVTIYATDKEDNPIENVPVLIQSADYKSECYVSPFFVNINAKGYYDFNSSAFIPKCSYSLTANYRNYDAVSNTFTYGINPFICIDGKAPPNVIIPVSEKAPNKSENISNQSESTEEKEFTNAPLYDITMNPKVIIGEKHTVKAIKDNKPFPNAKIVAEDPFKNNITFIADKDGIAIFSLQIRGRHTISLLSESNQVVRARLLEVEDPPIQPFSILENPNIKTAIIIIVIAIVSFIVYINIRGREIKI